MWHWHVKKLLRGKDHIVWPEDFKDVLGRCTHDFSSLFSSLSYTVLDNLHGPVREEGKIIYLAYHIRLFFPCVKTMGNISNDATASVSVSVFYSLMDVGMFFLEKDICFFLLNLCNVFPPAPVPFCLICAILALYYKL